MIPVSPLWTIIQLTEYGCMAYHETDLLCGCYDCDQKKLNNLSLEVNLSKTDFGQEWFYYSLLYISNL